MKNTSFALYYILISIFGIAILYILYISVINPFSGVNQKVVNGNLITTGIYKGKEIFIFKDTIHSFSNDTIKYIRYHQALNEINAYVRFETKICK
jgi:hypothetical protein